MRVRAACGMRSYGLLLCLWLAAAAPALRAASGQEGTPDAAGKQNASYLVESVDLSGGSKNQISRGLRADLESLVGRRPDPKAIEGLARRIREELQARDVTSRLVRGAQPDSVIVEFEVKGKPSRPSFDMSLPKGIYHSRQGWSGVLEARLRMGDSRITGGLVSDGDERLERFAGVKAGFEQERLGTSRLRLGFQFASYHQQWNPATVESVSAGTEAPPLYRARQDFAPSLTLVLDKPLTLTVGASFQRLDMQDPALGAEAANAATAALRFAHAIEGLGGETHSFEVEYSLRAAARTLNSDYVYSKHVLTGEYEFRQNRHRVTARAVGGVISGAPPLFDRFSLGNTATLRGWRKFDVSPVGGTRVAHGALEYAYRGVQAFYDTGALWTREKSGDVKHSVGVGFAPGNRFFLLLAFPLRAGQAQPAFMAGMSY